MKVLLLLMLHSFRKSINFVGRFPDVAHFSFPKKPFWRGRRVCVGGNREKDKYS